MKTTHIKQVMAVTLTCIIAFNSWAKVKPIGQTIQLRPVTIKNIAYASSGKYFAVPNFITAGSVAIFFISETGEIGSIPSRFNNKDFTHSAGVFYHYSSKSQTPSLAFLPLQELLSGYSVSYTPQGDTLAIAGNDKVLIYDSKSWKQIKSITITNNTTRAVFSPDGAYLAVIAGGKIYMLETKTYSLQYTLTPEQNHQFADISFTGNSSKLAAFEYRAITLDNSSRIRIYETKTGNLDRNLPYFTDKISGTPGAHFPLLSYSPADSAIAVNIQKSIRGKVLLIKSNDGTPIREFKGQCHAFSPDMTLFAAGGEVYSTADWKSLGNFSSSAVALAFSPTERVLLVLSLEDLRRYRIE